MRLNWDDQFKETDEEVEERWRRIKSKRIAKGKCWQCAKFKIECSCPNVRK